MVNQSYSVVEWVKFINQCLFFNSLDVGYHTLIRFYDRDMLLHREFFKELRELLREGVSMLKMFMNGRYIRGVEEVVNLDETG